MIAFDAVVVWLVTCVALGIAATPVTVAVLPGLGRYAPAFALPIALT